MKLEPKPLPCPKCGKPVKVSLTGWTLRNWWILQPDCDCFSRMESVRYFIDSDDVFQHSEEAYREMVESWNRRTDNVL